MLVPIFTTRAVTPTLWAPLNLAHCKNKTDMKLLTAGNILEEQEKWQYNTFLGLLNGISRKDIFPYTQFMQDILKFIYKRGCDFCYHEAPRGEILSLHRQVVHDGSHKCLKDFTNEGEWLTLGRDG